MNWEEFKREVEHQIRKECLDGTRVEIEYVDISSVNKERPLISVGRKLGEKNKGFLRVL